MQTFFEILAPVTICTSFEMFPVQILVLTMALDYVINRIVYLVNDTIRVVQILLAVYCSVLIQHLFFGLILWYLFLQHHC